MHGLAGCFVKIIEPFSEADPAALLVQFLIGFGNLIGRGPHFAAGADRHFTNLFGVVVGQTSKARKGMSWGQVVNALSRVDAEWADKQVKSGLASGEGLIAALTDASDRRLLICEPEFARVLTSSDRQGSTLPDIIRQAWDGGNLGVLTRNDPLEVKDALISMVGHVTVEELRSLLSEITALNGFANRYLWVCANRSKSLPDGDPPPEDDIRDLVEALKVRIEEARQIDLIERDAEARALWHEIYPQLTEGTLGRLGAVTARAEAQVMRLACIYALLDGTATVAIEHLKAGLAVWRYCEDSARFIFGDSLGNAVADRILGALRARGKDGMTRTEINALFQGNKPKSSIEQALTLLNKTGLARSHQVKENPTQRRPTEQWTAV
jgi:hypothetical protein